MLSKGEYDILNRIVGYGGYVTKEILHLYRKDITQDRCYRIICNLERKGYLRNRGYFVSHREPNVYQVTKKACAYFGRPEAYMRKVHKAFAMRRYLMRSHFLFNLAGQGESISLFSSDERATYVRKRGYSSYHLPKKINKDTISIQMEEYILDTFTQDQSITFLYVDNIRYSIVSQIYTLLNRYQRMLSAKIDVFHFIIAVENDDRAYEFQKIYKEKFENNNSLVNIKIESINRNYQCEIR
ncbi:hypothetical protein [Sinanaerobacter sp. ZZT-01]|uniref:hypothetical protein n=1 Tax=Sinanaerobacter sp. ZZT-01 TaxID=3111540 RepID=UPI002D7775E0|nr:hypothetical protein [Sinanaerobacter sp. ZZT-01]WRR93388.1 hypothetical protein U5921_15365 [Sinanaerobacter sp. ZZT-01]